MILLWKLDVFIIVLDAATLYHMVRLHERTTHADGTTPRSLAGEQGFFLGRGLANLSFELLAQFWQPPRPGDSAPALECEAWDSACIADRINKEI